MRRNILWAAAKTCCRWLGFLLVCLLTLGVRASAQELPSVVLITDDACPLAVEGARRVERLQSLDLAISGWIINPGRRVARGLVVTAAHIDADGRVTNLQMKSLDLTINAQSQITFRAVFDGFAPTRNERVAFGIQAVRWSGRDEWHGALRLTTAPTVLASKDGVGN